MTDFILISMFLSFPEAIIMLLIGLKLCSIRINLKKVLLISFIQASVAFLIKLTNINFGIQSIVQIITFWVLIILILKMKSYKAIVPVLIGFFIDGIIQQLIISIANNFIKIDFSKLSSEFEYTFIYSLFILSTSLFVLLIIHKTRFIFCDLSVEGEVIGEQK